MEEEGSALSEHSHEDCSQRSNQDLRLSSAIRDDSADIATQEIAEIFSKIYDVEEDICLEFPSHFQRIPGHMVANRMWEEPLSFQDVSDRLLGNTANDGNNRIPENILAYFAEMVDVASQKITELLIQFDDNEHHFDILDQATESQKIPLFLKFKAPKIKFFPADIASELEKDIQKELDDISMKMLTRTRDERNKIRSKLCNIASNLTKDLMEEAATKWMDAQGNDWNAWDLLYRVEKIGIERGRRVKQWMRLSSAVFINVMNKCRIKVTATLEARREEKSLKVKKRIEESKKRKEIQQQITALPLEGAEKNISQRVQELIQPLRIEIQQIKEKIAGNVHAPMLADAYGATRNSAGQARHLDSKSRTKKRRKRTQE